jgi:hypothetical protein
MELGLDSLIDGKRIVKIDGAPIPAPPHAIHPGEYLYVNCHYDVGMAKIPLNELYQIARSDALEIVRRLGTNSAVRKLVGVVVRIQGHFPCPGAMRPARRRVYEVSILTTKLPPGDPPITEDNLTQMGAFESSQIDDIAELMHQTAS